MTFDAFGNATGGTNGSIEAIGGRLRIGNGGGFVCDNLGGIYDSPPVRNAITPAPYSHGGYVSSTFYDPRIVTVEGRIIADTLSEMWTALDLLKQDFAAAQSFTYRVRMQGWPGARRFIGRPAEGGLVVSTEGAPSTPVRGFQVTLVAADPRLYGETQRTLTFTPNTTQSVSVAGTAPTPLRTELDGAFTAGSALANLTTSKSVGVDGTIATGTTVILDSATATAYGAGSLNYYSRLTGAFFELDPQAGTSQSLRANVGSPGTGAATRVIFRDAWW